jgi:hypothetical protein
MSVKPLMLDFLPSMLMILHSSVDHRQAVTWEDDCNPFSDTLMAAVRFISSFGTSRWRKADGTMNSATYGDNSFSG